MTPPENCNWPGNDEQMIAYHDTEWGTPCFDDHKLFEYVVLDTMQAGLSWSIVLHKRESMRAAFAGFDATKVAAFSQEKLDTLLENPGIIRNRLKLKATVTNAQAFLEIQKEFGSFATYIWSFVGGRPIVHQYEHGSHIGSTSPESDAMSADLKKRGFKFVGSTICYAFMQGAGLINDHVVTCFRHAECQKLT